MNEDPDRQDIKQILGKYVDEHTVEYLVNNPDEFQHHGDLEIRSIYYLIIYIDWASIEHLFESTNLINELTARNNGYVDSFFSGIYILAFGLIPSSDSRSDCLNTVDKLLNSKFGKRMKLLSGFEECPYGLIGSAETGRVTFAVKAFGSILCKLNEVSYGSHLPLTKV
jgi:hypothetical protein